MLIRYLPEYPLNPRQARIVILFLAMCDLACAHAACPPQASESLQMQPAPSPSEAMERAVAAMAEGDDVAFRRITAIRSPHGYSEGHFRWGLASQRLHRAIRQHGVTRQRIRSAGFDRSETLASAPDEFTDDDLEQYRKTHGRVKWRIKGDVALENGERSSTSTAGVQTVERCGRGWIVVYSDPDVARTGDPSAETMSRYGEAWAMLAAAMNAAADEVGAGRLKTMLEVNDFVKAISGELAKRNPTLSTAPRGEPAGR